MAEPVVHPVGDGPVVVERGVDLLDGLQHVVDPAHVQERLLLTGERGVRQVLGRGAGANGPGQVATTAVLGLEPLERCGDLGVELGREAGGLDRGADARTRCAEGGDVVDVQILDQPPDHLVEPGLVEETAVGVGRRGEAEGHPYPRRAEVLHHLPQRRVLAADPGQVVHAELGEPEDVGAHALLLVVRVLRIDRVLRGRAGRGVWEPAVAGGGPGDRPRGGTRLASGEKQPELRQQSRTRTGRARGEAGRMHPCFDQSSGRRYKKHREVPAGR